MKNFSSISSDYVKHEYIKTNSILKKQYQTSAATQSLDKNLLVVLPTGTGKPVIMLLLIIFRIHILTVPSPPTAIIVSYLCESFQEELMSQLLSCRSYLLPY